MDRLSTDSRQLVGRKGSLGVGGDGRPAGICNILTKHTQYGSAGTPSNLHYDKPSFKVSLINHTGWSKQTSRLLFFVQSLFSRAISVDDGGPFLFNLINRLASHGPVLVVRLRLSSQVNSRSVPRRRHSPPHWNFPALKISRNYCLKSLSSIITPQPGGSPHPFCSSLLPLSLWSLPWPRWLWVSPASSCTGASRAGCRSARSR